MRCWTSSIVSCRTLPGSRASSRQAANRSVNPSWVSRALISTRPPSALASGRSKRATTGFANPSPWKVTCGIQSVAIEPPRVGAVKRLDTASIAPARGSVALLFHLSRIFQVRRERERPDRPRVAVVVVGVVPVVREAHRGAEPRAEWIGREVQILGALVDLVPDQRPPLARFQYEPAPQEAGFGLG